jgi:hypothetical protein
MPISSPRRLLLIAVLTTALVAASLIAARGESGSAGAAPIARASKAVTYVQKTFTMSQSNEKRRLTVRCPGRLVPLGGGMNSSPTPDQTGEGVYPHSYERLGVQHGFHATPVLFDQTGGTRSYSVTLQVACSQKQEHVTPPHKTVYVNPGETKTAVATCPGRRHLFGGGFQRTDFVGRGGNYATESRAITSKSWAVTGHAFGNFGGELTAIAYCWRSKRPLLTEVSASTEIMPGGFATAVTPPCPRGKLVFGGFQTTPPNAMFFTNGYMNNNGSWQASAHNHFGPTGTLTAYGYCLKL